MGATFHVTIEMCACTDQQMNVISVDERLQLVDGSVVSFSFLASFKGGSGGS